MNKLKKKRRKNIKNKINKYIQKYNLKLEYNDKFTVKIIDLYKKINKKKKKNKNFIILLKIAINFELFYIFLENVFLLFDNNSSLKNNYIF